MSLLTKQGLSLLFCVVSFLAITTLLMKGKRFANFFYSRDNVRVHEQCDIQVIFKV